MEKIVQKMYLIYIYVQTGTTKKHSITNSMSERTNMLTYEKPTSYAAWWPWWLNWLRLRISHKLAWPGFEIKVRLERFRGK